MADSADGARDGTIIERSRGTAQGPHKGMRQQRTLFSSGNDTAKAINLLRDRWRAFMRFLDDGRVCLSNNAAERALRGVAIGPSEDENGPSPDLPKLQCAQNRVHFFRRHCVRPGRANAHT